jgi:hypothetical protein
MVALPEILRDRGPSVKCLSAKVKRRSGSGTTVGRDNGTERNTMMEPQTSAAAAARHDDPETERAAGLREEIDFWAGMLEASQDTATAESIERMTFALALAEFRLRKMRHEKPD